MDHDHAAFSLDLASYTSPTQKQVYWAFTIQKVQLSVPIKEVFQTYINEKEMVFIDKWTLVKS